MRVISRREKIRLALCQIYLSMLDRKGLFLSSFTLNVPIFFISFNLIYPAKACRV